MQDKVQIRSLDSTRIGLHHQVQTHQIKHQGKEQMVLSKVEILVYLWTSGGTGTAESDLGTWEYAVWPGAIFNPWTVGHIPVGKAVALPLPGI